MLNMSILRTLCFLLFAFVHLIQLGGCTTLDQPSMRLGSLPFPGPFSLYAEANPDDLGIHEYRPFLTLLNNEESRGILYTCHAGFLDLSHVRDAIDLTRHFYQELRYAVQTGERKGVVAAFSPCHFHITLDVPFEWAHALRSGQIPTDVDEALIELAVQLSWIATTWYEILQWAGYSSVGLVPEGRSAFTYDDVIAHAVGGDVAREALRESQTEDQFNAAATKWLEELLGELGVVSQEALNEAVRLVEGKWWQGFSTIRRQLDIGLNDGEVRPWLVRGLEVCDDVDAMNPEPYRVPPLQDSLRPDGLPFAHVEIQMRIWEARRIRATIPRRPVRIVPHRDFPHIMQAIRQDLIGQFGENVDRPYDDWPSRWKHD